MLVLCIVVNVHSTDQKRRSVGRKCIGKMTAVRHQSDHILRRLTELAKLIEHKFRTHVEVRHFCGRIGHIDRGSQRATSS